MPWGVDDTFHLKDDPNPFDNIGDPPPSVLALTAIPNRLYNNPDWRVKYATRLKEILDTAWDEDELLVTVDEMAAIVRQHAVPEVANGAADDTERVRKFILKRKGEILSDLIPEPPDWPAPEAAAGQSSGSMQMTFQTTWGSNLSPNLLEAGTLISLSLDEAEEPVEGVAVLAGYSSPDEKVLLPDVEQTASLVVLQVDDDGGLTGMTLVVALDLLAPGATLVIGDGTIAGGVWSIPAGAATPDSFTPFTQGQLELSEAGSRTGAVIFGSFSGVFGDPSIASGVDETGWQASGSLEVRFATAWGTNQNADPFSAGGWVTYLNLNDIEESGQGVAVTAGHASPLEYALLPYVDRPASIYILGLEDDGSVTGLTLLLPSDQLNAGATLAIGKDEIAGGVWTIPAESSTPESVIPFTQGQLDLSQAGSAPGAVIAGSFSGMYGPCGPYGPDARTDTGTAPVNIGLVINEVAAKGGPMDWFELHNASDNPIALDRFLVADDLSDAAKRVPFPAGTTIQPGQYLQFQLDKDSWPGFALGGDEELGIWLPDGTLVDSVDWNEGQSGEAQSYARLPDLIGEFQTVTSPTPGAPNQP